MEKDSLTHSQSLLSIIVPVYNVEQYIGQCLDSLISQSYTSLEIILVNDGSTDDSPRICEQYAERDSRIRVIHKANGGLSSARNAGLEVARGAYISFIDSDDWVDATMYEKAINIFSFDPELSIVRFGLLNHYFNSSGAVHHRSQTIRQSELILEGADILEAYSDEDKGLDGIVCSSVYRHDLLSRYELTFIEGILHEDEAFSLSLLSRLAADGGKIKIVRDTMYNYRRISTSITGSIGVKHMYGLCKGLEMAFSYGVKHKVYLPALHSKIVTAICKLYGGWLKNGISFTEITSCTATIRANKPNDSNYKPVGKWLYNLFCYSPRLFYCVERVYAPVVRRLGISKRYR